MTELAATEGLAYDFDSVRHTKTLTAHELLHLAKAKGMQLDVVERLFSAYFEQGRHLGDIDTLVEIGAEAGLETSEVRTALSEGTYRDAVQRDIEQARAYGISGVPFYVLDSKYGVSGAQPPQVFAETLNKIAEEKSSGEAEVVR